MTPSQPSVFKSLRDFVIVAGIMAALNSVIARDDPGWTSLNPTPWLLLPALIGARYGLFSGLLTGVLTAAGIAIAQAHGSLENAREFVQLHPYFFTVIVLTGYLAGEGGRVLRRQNAALYEKSVREADELARLKAEIELSREARQQLQQDLALHNAAIAGIDDDLRKLLSGPPESLMQRLLLVLRQHCQLGSAAIYRRSGDMLTRTGDLNPCDPLKETLHLDTVPIARRALQERALVSVKNAEETSDKDPFLLALPFGTGEDESCLLVQDMPLKAFVWPNLARMEMIIAWVTALHMMRKDFASQGQLVPAAAWKLLLAQALASEQAHHVPSIVMKVAADAAAEKTLVRALPPTAVAARLPDNKSVVVLLPFGGEMEASALAADWTARGLATKPARYTVAGSLDPEALWKRLQEG